MEKNSCTETFVWTINNFYTSKQETGQYHYNPFGLSCPNGDKLELKLYIYPNGHNEETKGIVCVRVSFNCNKNEVCSNWHFAIRNSDGVDKIKKDTPRLIMKGYKFRDTELIKLEELLNEENGFLLAGRLTLICKFIIYAKNDETVSVDDFLLPKCRMADNMAELFERTTFTDCRIVASQGNKKFKVHKCILASRSPVFGRMFEHEMTESRENIIKIDDIEAAVLEQMLRFIYTGQTPILKDMGKELMKAADKYELDRLKMICERSLAHTMTTENACGLFVFAYRLLAEHLKARAIKFIAKHSKEVIKTEGWKMLVNENDAAELMGEIVQGCVDDK